MIFKFLLFLSILFAADGIQKDFVKKTFLHEDVTNFIRENQLQNVEGNAVVVKSNLPQAMQNRVASILTSIYQNTSDKMQRAQQFQTSLAQLMPVYWNVVINFDVVTFYSQYYALLDIDGDRVLGFGLS